MNSSPASHPTLTEEVHEHLRGDLLGGVLAPGSKLKPVELAARFNVSQSVVREALARLSQQGLIVATPQRGFRVRDLSVDDISALTEARTSIESLTLRMSMDRGDIHWETGVLTAFHILDRTPVTHPDGAFNELWPVYHRDFHRSLLGGCGNAHLEAIATSLRDSAELYRRWYWVLTDDHQRDIAAEHARLKELVLLRDADAACELLCAHIQRAPDQLISYAQTHGVETLEQPRG